MSIFATGWIPFKKRKEYPLIRDSWIELPDEGTMLVWDANEKDPEKAVWMACYRKSLEGEDKFVVAVYGYDTYLEDEREFDVADDDFPFLAWLYLPDISDVIASADDFFVPPWWETDKDEVSEEFREAWTNPNFWEENGL